jgi:predicted dehydrogenase/threonine dehydrogenase-like Zn-dependent dehydrogenase/REP element-mobilizing transposase RayT
MKQLAQYQDGRLELQDVPAPVPPPGGILVRTTCSVISPGTERMKVEQARMSLLQKAKARPDQVKKVIDTAKTLGWKAALEKVRNRLESPTPLGYSAAGVVVAVDELNSRFRVGDRVACGGAECAFHAEMIAVPDLLAAPVPEGVEDWQAAYTTLASISMQAVRQAEVRLGDRVMVMGQGLVGLLATSLLKASGARVLAVDFVSARLQTALAMGAERVVNPAETKVEDVVREWTHGHGVDAVIICVGGKSSGPADQAIACLRDRGVMVITGIYDAELSWKTAYMKDIQVRYSRSYGPGRYDPQYEWGGKDYPIGYVRWTENRNFEACLELMRTGQLDLRPVTTRRVGFGDVLDVYDKLESELGVVIEYESRTGVPPVPSDAGILPAYAETGKMPGPPVSGETPDLRAFIPYDPNKKTDKARRHLPHWEQEGVTQFVTFRQADAIAQEKLDQWHAEREVWLRDHSQPWDFETEELYHRLFSERLETWLDQGSGSCVLAREEAARLVENAMRHFDGERYILDAYVIMPNHVHVLLKPLHEHTLSDIMHSWKSFTSREIKKLYDLGAEPFWQGERFDHALRSEAALEAKREYITQNPAKLKSGFRVGRGIGVVGRTGILPVSSASGILPEAMNTGKMPVTQVTGGTPVLHVIGAGNFARTMLLPHLKGNITLGTIVNATGLSARHVREKFGFSAAETDAAKVFGSETGCQPVASEQAGSLSHAAVMIGTRHHLHAPLVLKALHSGKHTFVEKPLCLTREELSQIDEAMTSTTGSVMVGFNRRFAPATVAMMQTLQNIPGPKTLAFHVNAGVLAPDHWYANIEESGGRVLGEACHFFDFACHVLGRPLKVTAQTVGRPAVPDSVTAQIEFADGSSAQIVYSAEGDSAFPKESFRVFGNGAVIECENFMRLSIFQNRKQTVKKFASKGHAEEMATWLAFLKGGSPHPLPYEQARQSMRLTFAVLESIREGRGVAL